MPIATMLEWDNWFNFEAAEKYLRGRGFALTPSRQWCRQNSIAVQGDLVSKLELEAWCNHIGNMVIGQKKEL